MLLKRLFKIVFTALVCRQSVADSHHQHVIENDAHDLASLGVSLISFQEYLNWVNQESAISFDRMVNNVAYEGNSLLEGVLSGSVVASPSRSQPDYFYIWTRDCAVIMNIVFFKYADGDARNGTLNKILGAYVNSTYDIQRVINPSGNFETLEGLGEPKYQVDGSAFLGSWGRPQKDGPALRATTIMNYLTLLNKFDDPEREIFFQVIKPDLDYVEKFWRDNGFDLWEEINGIHFFTLQVQERAMSVGAQFVRKLGYPDKADVYNQAAGDIRQMLKDNFFDSNKGYLKETLDLDKRSGLDTAVILGSLYASDANGNVSIVSDSLAPHSDEILATVSALVSDMRSRFPINRARLSNFKSAGAITTLVGVGVGRYPEDVYDGVTNSIGNPWFLCTAAIAETLYILARHLYAQKPEFRLEINSVNLEFYREFLASQDSYQIGYSLERTSSVYDSLICQIINYGDSFLDVIREHQDLEGNLSEQFSRETGYMTGASKLTWSFGQFYRAARQRQFALKDMYKTIMTSQKSCNHMII